MNVNVLLLPVWNKTMVSFVARGNAQAVYNDALSEARSIQEIGRSIDITEDPTRYLLALKYIEVLKQIIQSPKTTVCFGSIPDLYRLFACLRRPCLLRLASCLDSILFCLLINSFFSFSFFL